MNFHSVIGYYLIPFESAHVISCAAFVFGPRFGKILYRKDKGSGPDMCSQVNCGKGGERNQWTQN